MSWFDLVERELVIFCWLVCYNINLLIFFLLSKCILVWSWIKLFYIIWVYVHIIILGKPNDLTYTLLFYCVLILYLLLLLLSVEHIPVAPLIPQLWLSVGDSNLRVKYISELPWIHQFMLLILYSRLWYNNSILGLHLHYLIF